MVGRVGGLWVMVGVGMLLLLFRRAPPLTYRRTRINR